MKRFLKALIAPALVLCLALAAYAGATQALFSGVTATGAQTAVSGISSPKTFQVWGSTSAGTGTAAVSVEGSNNGLTWDSVGTVSLALGTVTTSGSFTSIDRYALTRGNVTSISGTGAIVNLTAGF